VTTASLERQRRVLDDADVEPPLLEELVDTLPTRAVTKPPWTSTTFLASVMGGPPSVMEILVRFTLV